jgi:Phytanoyl-CoA dioxygenase (PhyH)
VDDVLTAREVEHFRLFGFVVLREFLDPDTTSRQRSEVQRALRDAYRERFDKRVDTGGISGHYLPMMAASTPVSQALVADDGRLMAAAARLLARPVLPDHAEGILYFRYAAWHFDDGIGVDGVKFSAYLDRLDAGNGALRLLLGSHDRAVHARLRAYEREPIRAAGEADMPRHVAGLPGYVAATRPGDVVAFHTATWHCSHGGKDRLAWTIEYLPDPATEEERSRFMEWMRDSCDLEDRHYDHRRYPLHRDWAIDAD